MKTSNILYFPNPAEPEPKRATALLPFNKFSAIKNTKIILKRLTFLARFLSIGIIFIFTGISYGDEKMALPVFLWVILKKKGLTKENIFIPFSAAPVISEGRLRRE